MNNDQQPREPAQANFSNDDQSQVSSRAAISKARIISDGKIEQKICRFFSNSGRCTYGENCRFVHEIQKGASNENSVNSPLFSSKETFSKQSVQKVKPCRYSAQSAACPFGEKCRFSHDFKNSQSENGTRSANTNRRIAKNTKYSTTEFGGDRRNEMPLDFESEEQTALIEGILPSESLKGKFVPVRPPSPLNGAENAQCSKPLRRRPKTFTLKSSQSASETEKQPSILSETKHEASDIQAPQFQSHARPALNFCLKRTEVSAEKLAQLRQTDINSAKKRFPSYKEIADGQISVEIPPTDPDWPFDVKAIGVELFFPDSYPLIPFSATVKGPEALPELLISHLTRNCSRYLEEERTIQAESNIVELYLRKFIRWLDRNLERLFIEGLRKVRLEMQAKAAGISVVTFDQKKKTEPPSEEIVPFVDKEEDEESVPLHLCSSDREYETGSSDGKEEQLVEKNVQAENVQLGAVGAQKRPGAIEVRLSSAHFSETVASVFVSKITLIVECTRCRLRLESTLSLSPSFRADSKCTRRYSCAQCHKELSVEFCPSLVVQQNDHLLGDLWTDGCLPVDLVLLTSEFHATCLGCNQDTRLKGLAYGTPLKTWCRECNTKLEVSIEAIRFLGSGSGLVYSKMAIGFSEVPLRMKKMVKDPRVHEGMPLPENGTCKHYKKSYRWLRFPCCGKTYPCDVCHEENETHEMKLANRMVCGFCAKEQSYQSSKPCVSCGGSVTKARSSHWEGGKGCRDAIAMSRNDKAKYSGVNKTVSKRVQEMEEKKKKKKAAK